MKNLVGALVCLALTVVTGSAAAENISSVTQFSYDVNLRPLCSAVRMNPDTYSSLPADACALATTSATYGPDRITKTIYDAAGQVVQVRQAVGTSVERAYATYSYSNNGKVIDTVDANGNRTTLGYDGFDRIAALFYPSPTRPSNFNSSTPSNAIATAGAFSTSDVELYDYDKNGNRTLWQRRDGQVFHYTYDNLNRQTVKDVPGTSSGDIFTGYDLQGHVLYNRFGSTTGAGTQYWYNALGEMTSTADMNGHSIWKGSRYHNGIDTALVWPDGQGLNTDNRDALNRVTTAYFGCCGLVAYTGGYDSLGHLTSIGRQGGSTTWGYDNIGRLTSMTNDLNGATYDIGWTFDYNPAGQLYTSTASSTTYDYKETINSTDGPTYDGLNRDSRLVGTTSACPSGGYDARQNLICDSLQSPNRTFTYDVENRMLTGASTSANVKMVYDPEGRLSKYSTDGGSTWFTLLYDGARLIAYYDNSGAMVARFIHGDGVDQPLVWMINSGTNNMRPLYTDYHGSVIADTDSAGTLTNLYKYGPYGEPKNISNAEYWDGSPFRYTGQIALPQLQLYYYKARVYDPKWGRFLQTDPIGSKDDLDLYAYVHGDPVNNSDPTGLDTIMGEIGVEITPGIGFRASIGAVVQVPGINDNPFDSKSWDIGITGSVGGAAGLKGDIGGQASWAPGTIKDNEGVTVGANVTTPLISGSASIPIAAGKTGGVVLGGASPQVSRDVSTGGQERITGRAKVNLLEKMNIKVGEKVGIGASVSMDARGSITIQKVIDFFSKKRK